MRNKQNPIDFIEAGDIGAAGRLKISKLEIHCVMKTSNYHSKYEIPAPVIGILIEPKTKADVDKMGMAFS
jgi:elongation factor G